MKFPALRGAAIAAAAVLSFSNPAQATAVVLDFNLPGGNMIDPLAQDCLTAGNGGLRCGTTQTFAGPGGLNVVASTPVVGGSVSQAFSALAPRGLGVFSVATPASPAQADDAPLQAGEALTLNFTSGFLDITQILFTNGNTAQGPLSGQAGAFAYYDIGGGDQLFDLTSPLSFSPFTFITRRITFRYGNQPFYLSSITGTPDLDTPLPTVPEPGSLALAGLALALLAARTARQTA